MMDLAGFDFKCLTFPAKFQLRRCILKYDKFRKNNREAPYLEVNQFNVISGENIKNITESLN